MRQSSLLTLLLAGCLQTENKPTSHEDSLFVDTGDTADPGAPEDTGDTGGPEDTAEPTDADGDGFDVETDCDDDDAAVNPDAPEECGDGIDNDCSGEIDETCPRSLSEADASLMGERTDDYAGASVSPAGDINGDGHADLLVGARNHDVSGGREGAAYVVFGPLPRERRVLTDLPGVRVVGVESAAGTGKLVRSVGDVDGDGLHDVMVSTDEGDGGGYTNNGLVHLFTGAQLAASVGEDLQTTQATATWHGPSNYGWLGVGITPAGDVDGDGRDDIWMGASGDKQGNRAAGAVYLLTATELSSAAVGDGNSTPILTDATTVQLVGDEERAYLGAQLAGGLDLNSDGVPDLVVGVNLASRNGDGSGEVRVLLGGATGTVLSSEVDIVLVGDQTGDQAGSAVSPAGDMNADGHDDLWVGAARVDTSNADAGAVYLLHGGPDFGDREGLLGDAWDARLLGGSAGDGLGTIVSGGEDINADGIPDVLCGTPTSGNTVQGALTLVVGPVTGSMDVGDGANRTWLGVASEDRAGQAVGFGGDLFADGTQTLLVSAWESDRSARDAGEVYVLDPEQR